MNLDTTPGLLFVIGALLPLLGCLVLISVALLRGALRPYVQPPAGKREVTGFAVYLKPVYLLLGGDQPGYGAGIVATIATGLAALFGLLALGVYFDRATLYEEQDHAAERAIVTAERRLAAASLAPEARQAARQKQVTEAKARRADVRTAYLAQWNGRVAWLQVSPAAPGVPSTAPLPGTTFYLGFKIDGLSATLFVMIALVSLLVHVYSLGYMNEEAEAVEDEEVPTEAGPYRRRGRIAVYYLYLGLFTFAMLHLILADNLLQVFLSWELVGICSYLLIGFWHEQPEATPAANKAFLLNRAGDVGFLAGLAILWTAIGTLGFDELERRLRAPVEDRQGLVTPGGQFVYASSAEPGRLRVTEPGEPGERILLLPLVRPQTMSVPRPGETIAAVEGPTAMGFGSISPWLLALAGLCLFIGCMGKSAQVPLQTWLPDAMVGPTPISALIHAATMVAAGVYLVGRIYPILTPGVLLVIAYVGLVGLVVGGVTALFVVDLKRILAFSTISQLGMMFLGLGVGGWTAGLFHLTTHAFIKACLFLGAGCVLYATAGEGNIRKLGCLALRMPLTAAAMLLATLALAGMPFFAGWYSKDAILSQALGFVMVHPWHLALFLVPLLMMGVTAFYLFRMWILIFQGLPREPEPFLRAEEPPTSLTFPLMLLALLSMTVAWGMPPWDPHASWLENRLHHAQPLSVQSDFGTVPEQGEVWLGGAIKPPAESERLLGQHYGRWVILAALLCAGAGVYLAYRWYAPKDILTEEELLLALGVPLSEVRPQRQSQPTTPRLWPEEEPAVTAVTAPTPERVAPPMLMAEPGRLGHFLAGGFGLDALYRLLFVRPALWLGWLLIRIDTLLLNGLVRRLAIATVVVAKVEGRVDRQVVDGAVDATGRSIWRLGGWLRYPQTGWLRSYVLFLILAAVGLFVVVSVLVGWSTAG